jgi:DNA-binding response OmpR family regulator
MAQPLNVLLLVEDDDNDIIITKRKIAKANLAINELLITKSLSETKDTLKTKSIDVILLDLNLPDSIGLDTVDGVRNMYDGIIVVLTSIDDEHIGIEAIRHGADEYLVKSQLTEKALHNAIYYGLARKQRQDTLKRVNSTLEMLSSLK